MRNEAFNMSDKVTDVVLLLNNMLIRLKQPMKQKSESNINIGKQLKITVMERTKEAIESGKYPIGLRSDMQLTDKKSNVRI